MFRVSPSRRLLFLAAVVCGASVPGAQQVLAASGPDELPINGLWEAPFQHDLTGFPSILPSFNAVHMGLIPKGQHRGKVIVWDVLSDTRLPEWKQRWSIVDVSGPGPAVCLNDQLSLPVGEGDFFCAGFTWTAEGNLFLAGGTSSYPTQGRHPSGPGNYLGGRMAYLWDPFVGSMGWWVRQPNLEVDRWYPTVLKTGSGSLVVAGGTANTSLDFFSDNDFETFLPSGPLSGAWQLNGAQQRFNGPPGFGPLSIYPRLFHLSTGEQFLAGMSGIGTKMRVSATPGQWSSTATSEWDYRSYGTAVLLPFRPDSAGNYRDEVLILGGNAADLNFHVRDAEDGDYPVKHGGTVALVETCFPGSATPADWNWIQGPSLHHARSTANAVILADGSVLAIGGRVGAAANEHPVYVPELYDGTRWIEMPVHSSPRTYHSTAVLLPSGKVLSGGGDSATQDYQVFVPPYLRTGRPRPVVSSSPPTMGYRSVAPTDYTIGFEPRSGRNGVAYAALISPGAVTHHTDVNQRYIQLVTQSVSSTQIVVQAPRDSDLVPPGYYMLFLVSAAGVPSEAVWVKVG